MKNFVLISTLICTIACMAFAQEDAKIRGNRYEVTVMLKKDKTNTKAGFFLLKQPWHYQKSVTIFNKDLAKEKKIKNKHQTSYKPKDILGYKVGNRTFKSVKATLLPWDGNATLKMLPKRYFLEVLQEGTITIYKGYANPPTVYSSSEDPYGTILREPQYFLQKEDGKLKNTAFIDMEKWLADAPKTQQDYLEGKYGTRNQEEGKKLGNLIGKMMDNDNIDGIFQMITDYNEELAGQ